MTVIVALKLLDEALLCACMRRGLTHTLLHCMIDVSSCAPCIGCLLEGCLSESRMVDHPIEQNLSMPGPVGPDVLLGLLEVFYGVPEQLAGGDAWCSPAERNVSSLALMEPRPRPAIAT